MDTEGVQGTRDSHSCEASEESEGMEANKTCSLVFPTSGCNPKLDFLDCLKAVAERAGLEQENFWLHKFRATSRPGHCGLASISVRYSSGWATQTWNSRCDT